MHSAVGFPCQVWLREVTMGLDEIWLRFPICRKCYWAGHHCEPSPFCWPPVQMARVMCCKLTAWGRASEMLSGVQLLHWAVLKWSWNLLRHHWLSATWQRGINAWIPVLRLLKGTLAYLTLALLAAREASFLWLFLCFLQTLWSKGEPLICIIEIAANAAFLGDEKESLFSHLLESFQCYPLSYSPFPISY